jgi:prepilin-type N-terminal cleavage/methylation domain-containing protein
MRLIPRRCDDSGYSLIELLVVIILLGVVGSIITTTLVSGMRSTRQTQNRAYSTENVQAQLERIARDIRVADPIRAASATSITLDNMRGAGPGCVRETWALSSGNLVRTAITFSAWASCSVYPATATPTSTVTQTVVSSIANGSTPIFAYKDASGAALASPTPSKVAVVHVVLVQAGKEGRASVTFETSVGVRNEALA